MRQEPPLRAARAAWGRETCPYCPLPLRIAQHDHQIVRRQLYRPARNHHLPPPVDRRHHRRLRQRQILHRPPVRRRARLHIRLDLHRPAQPPHRRRRRRAARIRAALVRHRDLPQDIPLNQHPQQPRRVFPRHHRQLMNIALHQQLQRVPQRVVRMHRQRRGLRQLRRRHIHIVAFHRRRDVRRRDQPYEAIPAVRYRHHVSPRLIDRVRQHLNAG